MPKKIHGFFHPKLYINLHFISAPRHGGTKSTHGNQDDIFFNLFAGGTMIGQNSQEGEILAVSKLGKIYVDLTPLNDMNLMAQSVS